MNLAGLLTQAVFNEDNDFVVPVSSQRGGLSKFTHIDNEWHCGSTNNEAVMNEVVRLLKTSANSNEFSKDGINPPDIKWGGLEGLFRNAPLKFSSNDSKVQFTAIDKPQCANNEKINIRIAGSPDIRRISLVVEREYGNVYLETKEGNNSEFSYTVPEEAIGYKKILAIGYTDSQTAVTDTASFTVSTSASLVSLSTNRRELLVPLNGSQQVQVLGTYSDGTTKNISYLDNVQFTIKGSNAGLEAPNTITGLKEGVDTLVISCQGLETYLPVQVIDVGLAPTAVKPPVVKAHEMLKCYPNPAKDQITIAYELNESCSFARINMYDTKGQKVKTVELKNKDAGSHKEPVSIGNISKGVYIVVLSTDKGNSYQKLLKK